ncbi:MAG: hypothetical protein V4631_14655 [Pseudomonadota bacterium]
MNINTAVFRVLMAACLALVTGAAAAAAPSDLDKLVGSPACLSQLAAIGFAVDARDQGVSKAQVLKFNRSEAGADALPEELIENVFKFRKLERQVFESYGMWYCDARSRGLTALPLADVSAELAECLAKPVGSACLGVRNRVIGLPPDRGPQQ